MSASKSDPVTIWAACDGYHAGPELHSASARLTKNGAVIVEGQRRAFGYRTRLDTGTFSMTPEAAIEAWRESKRIEIDNLRHRIAAIEILMAKTPVEVSR